MKIKSKFGHTQLIKKGPQSKKKVPLIALHGGPGGTLIFLIDLLDLDKNRQVIIYDQLGSGKSSKLKKKDWKISTFVQQLDEIVAKLKLDSFHLLGSSWGATLALEYYKHRQGKGFRSLSLCSPLIPEKVWSKEAKRLLKTLPKKEQAIIAACEKIGATDSKVYQKAVALYYKKYVYRFRKKPSAKVEKYRKLFNEELYQHMWGPSEFSASGTLKNYNGVPILKNVRCPLLITCGQFDESTPESNRKFAKLHGKAQFKVIPRAAHVTMVENKSYFLKTVRSFLASTENS